MADETKNILIHIKGKVDDFNKKYDSVTKKADALKQKFQQVAKFVAGAFVAGRIVGAIKGMINKTMKLGAELDNLRKITGLNAIELQRLQYVATQANVPFEMLVKAFPKLAKAMGEAQDEQATYVDAFERMDIVVTKADGSLKDAKDVLLEITDYMNMSGISATTKMAAATNVLGKSGADLIPIFKLGREQIELYGDAAERMAGTLTNEMVDAIIKAKRSMEEYTATVDGLQTVLTIKVIPLLGEVIQRYTDLLQHSSPIIKSSEEISESFDKAMRSNVPFVTTLREMNEELARYRKEIELLRTTAAGGMLGLAAGLPELPPEPPKKKEDDLTKAGKEKIKIIKEMKKEWEDWERIQMVPSIPIPKTMGFEPWTSKLKKDTEEVKEEMIDLTEEVKEEVMDLEGVFSSLGSVMGKVLKGGKLEMGDFLSVLLGFLPAGSIWGKFLPFGKGGMTAIPRAAEGMVTKVNKPTITPHGVMAGDKYQTEWIFTGDQLTAYTKALKTTIVVHNAHPDTVVEEIGGLSESGQYNLQRILNNNILSKGKKLNR